jgi:hypothetical protein
MSTRDVIIQAVLGLLETIQKLVSAGDDRAAAEQALMEQAERNKESIDRIRFGGGP